MQIVKPEQGNGIPCPFQSLIQQSELQSITGRLAESSDLSSGRGQMPGGTREGATCGSLRCKVGEW